MALLRRIKMDASTNFNAFLGSETGILKGVNTERKIFNNLNSINNPDKNEEITSMCWETESQEEIGLGLRKQIVKSYNIKTGCFTKTTDVKAGSGILKGLEKLNRSYLTCVESGLVKLWKKKAAEQVEFEAGEEICRMRQNPQRPGILATGGKENDLKIWDIQNPQEPVFAAKNVANDFLGLRVPMWVLDLQFVPDSERVVLTTGHHHIRVYDPTTPQRRPVINMEFDQHPIMCLSLTNKENQIVVGNSRGRMALIDLRKKAMVHVYKGFGGSIRCIQCHPSLPLVASCGLDRFFRIHDLNSRRLLSKIYVKSRLNCLLLCNNFHDSTQNENQISEHADGETEKLWEEMADVSDEDCEIVTRRKFEDELTDDETSASTLQKRSKNRKKMKMNG